MSLKRQRKFHTFKKVREVGPYDEYPMLPPGIDPQLHLSRNDRPQPFFLICEKDTVIIQMSGDAKIELKDTSVLYFNSTVGDFTYIPAGTPHRIVPTTPSVHYRYKADSPGLEGIAWYCPNCDSEVFREVWDTAAELPQEGYWRVCNAFNDNKDYRTCDNCQHIHPNIDLGAYRWADVAANIRSGL